MVYLEKMPWCSTKIPPSGRQLTRPPSCWGNCLPTACHCGLPGTCPWRMETASPTLPPPPWRQEVSAREQRTKTWVAPWTRDVSKGPSSSGASQGMGLALCHRSAPPSSNPASPAGLPLRALPAHLRMPREESLRLFPEESELHVIHLVHAGHKARYLVECIDSRNPHQIWKVSLHLECS